MRGLGLMRQGCMPGFIVERLCGVWTECGGSRSSNSEASEQQMVVLLNGLDGWDHGTRAGIVEQGCRVGEVAVERAAAWLGGSAAACCTRQAVPTTLLQAPSRSPCVTLFT